MSWLIGRAFGIGVYLHWTFLLLPAWVILTNTGSNQELLLQLGVLAAAFGCVVLHEFGHALTARRYGIATRDITLYPIGGVARLERMTDKPWEEFWIAVAGPAVNVAIAALLYCALLPGQLVPGLRLDPLVAGFLEILLVVNVWLVLFNLLPAFPMDGGRVLRALLAVPLGHVKATQIAAALGVPMAILIGLGGWWLTNEPFLLAIGVFVYLAGQQELRVVLMREQMRLDEPIPVIPVHATAQSPAAFGLAPRVTVYTWDKGAGVWVPEEPPRPARRPWPAWD